MALNDHRAHGRSHGHDVEVAGADPAEVLAGRDAGRHRLGGLLVADPRGDHPPAAGLLSGGGVQSQYTAFEMRHRRVWCFEGGGESQPALCRVMPSKRMQGALR